MKKGFIICFCMITLIAMSFSGCADDTTGTTETNNTVASEKVKKKQETKYLYKDKYIKVSYVKLYDVKGIENVIYLQLKYENKTNKRIIVSPKDASVNKMAVTLLSGVPTNIGPKEKSMNPLIIPTGNIEAKKPEDIKNIKLKLWVTDEKYKSIETTKEINIKIK